MSKPPATPFKRTEVIGLVKRFLKENAYVPARDIPVFYKLYKQFPSEQFWRSYELSFKLNALFWFIGKDGQEKLKTDFALFNLDMPTETKYDMKDEKIGPDVKVEEKQITIADFLK